MKCSCCGEPRQNTNNRRSALLPGMSFNYCNDCDSKGHEPRFVIILAARSLGAPSVGAYVRGHKYSGADITASEIL